MGYRIYLSDRDIAALKFLWKWKISTTMAVAQKVFPKVQVISAYRRLCYLRQAGLIKTIHTDDRKGYAWTLTQNGFLAIREDLPTLMQEGFRSEHVRHDLHVAAFQLAPFFCHQPQSVVLVSEQELRHVDPQEHHQAIPKTNVHRPDGYWIFSKADGTHTVVALEVELNKKAIPRYEAVADFYRHTHQINEVFWLTKGPATSSNIQKAMRQDVDPKGARHSFISLDDFKKLGVHTPFTEGFRTGLRLQQILPNASATCQHNGDEKLLLETQICPFKSNHYSSKYFKTSPQLTRDSRLCPPHGETHE